MYFSGLINVISSYVYDRIKGELSGGGHAHLKMYSRTEKGKTKKFEYDGLAEMLPKILKGINTTDFFGD